MTRIIEVVYDNRDNSASILFSLGGTPIDFSAATRFLLTVGAVTVDTDTSPTAITTTATTGELEFLLGQEGLPVGKTNASLIVFDPGHTNGQVLACDSDASLAFSVVEC